MYSRRREAPLGLLSWGSNPYPYAPDGSDSALRGTGGGGANLESGLDNGPVMEGVPAPSNFCVNLPPLFLGHFSPIFARFFPVFSPFPPSCP